METIVRRLRLLIALAIHGNLFTSVQFISANAEHVEGVLPNIAAGGAGMLLLSSASVCVVQTRCGIPLGRICMLGDLHRRVRVHDL